jgi:hypothetical protein
VLGGVLPVHTSAPAEGIGLVAALVPVGVEPPAG